MNASVTSMAGMTVRRRIMNTDPWLSYLTVALLMVGLVMVFDAGYADLAKSKKAVDSLMYLKRQFIFTVIGFFAMFWMMRRDYRILRKQAVFLLIGVAILLLAVKIPGIGIERNGATRWIGYKAIQLQPSEFAKLALCIYLAAVLSRGVYNIKVFKDGLIGPLVVVGAIILLVELGKDLGTAMVIGLMSLSMLYMAGARLRHILAILGVAAIVVFIICTRHEYRMDRLRAYLDPERYAAGASYQVMIGLTSVGSGGAKGVGFGQGRGKFDLPESNTDFVFATLAEETGLWGSLLVIGLLLAIGLRGIVIGRSTQDPMGSLLAAGISAMILWQAFINIGAVTNTIPATGVPLPFISYGGSSIVVLMVAMGILHNIASDVERKPRMIQ